MIRSALLALAVIGTIAGPIGAQRYSLPPDLQAKIASHPNVRQVSAWGSRPDWSADSSKLLFVSREYGDVFELDVATGMTRPLTFHFSHAGILRAYYLPNGDYLLTAPRRHDPDYSTYGRFFESEMWVLKKDLSGPPIPLGQENIEGVAVSRDAMQIAYNVYTGKKPERLPDGQLDLMSLGGPNYQVWTADIVYTGGKPSLTNKRLVLDCGATTGTVATIVAGTGGRCAYLEVQNLLPGSRKLTLALAAAPTKPGATSVSGGYVLDLDTGRATLTTPRGYSELEGNFPDGRYSTMEHFAAGDEAHPLDATGKIDIWRVSLDGRREVKRMTFFHDLDPRLKADQSVVSPDGRWMAFGVSTGEVDKKVSGQSIGVYVMDLVAAGFR